MPERGRPWPIHDVMVTMNASSAAPPRTLVLFNYDWDSLGFDRWRREFPFDSVGFDLFSFPSNARLAGFDLERLVDRLAGKAKRGAGGR